MTTRSPLPSVSLGYALHDRVRTTIELDLGVPTKAVADARAFCLQATEAVRVQVPGSRVGRLRPCPGGVNSVPGFQRVVTVPVAHVLEALGVAVAHLLTPRGGVTIHSCVVGIDLDFTYRATP